MEGRTFPLPPLGFVVVSIVRWEELWGGEELVPREEAKALPLEEEEAIEGDWEFTKKE